MILQVILCIMAVIGFSLIFNVPRRELIFCGFTGAGGWLVLTLVTTGLAGSAVVGTLLAAMTASVFGRILSSLRKMPSTLYIIPGVLPLVPGSLLYRTMVYIVNGEHSLAVVQGVEALSRAGVIALGLLVVLSLPRRFFAFKRREV
ncbi:MAG: threonine/serine exporter family protein [Defluviitaleaceae bacterium]|nr:threonine/serine exporter family protein [Defluviitaleaceae bacterium]